jgi:5'-phosphate synthase pdxT subunit
VSLVRVGVLALQGDFREHAATIAALGAEPVMVRRPDDLDDIDALVIPGGESTTIGKLADWHGLIEPLRELISGGLPVLGTCAGMIFMAGGTAEGHDQVHLGVLDVVVRRNAFGRQVDSFEVDLEVDGLDDPLRAVFIRAPWIEKVGDGVEVLAAVDDHAVLVRQGSLLAASFHPELTGDGRLHRLLLDLIEEG